MKKIWDSILSKSPLISQFTFITFVFLIFYINVTIQDTVQDPCVTTCCTSVPGTEKFRIPVCLTFWRWHYPHWSGPVHHDSYLVTLSTGSVSFERTLSLCLTTYSFHSLLTGNRTESYPFKKNFVLSFSNSTEYDMVQKTWWTKIILHWLVVFLQNLFIPSVFHLHKLYISRNYLVIFFSELWIYLFNYFPYWSDKDVLFCFLFLVTYKLWKIE